MTLKQSGHMNVRNHSHHAKLVQSSSHRRALSEPPQREKVEAATTVALVRERLLRPKSHLTSQVYRAPPPRNRDPRVAVDLGAHAPGTANGFATIVPSVVWPPVQPGAEI